MDERCDSREGPSRAEIQLRVDTLEPCLEQSRRQPADPFIKIPGDNSSSRDFGIVEDVSDQKLSDLLAALEERGAEVEVHKVEFLSCSDVDLGPQATSRLTLPDANVVILKRRDRKAAEDSVSVVSAKMLSILAKAEMHPELFGQEFRLVFTPAAVRMAHNLLEGDDVGFELTEDVRYPLGRITAIDPDAFVNVVGRDPDRLHQLLR
jgi:hypothetical protein